MHWSDSRFDSKCSSIACPLAPQSVCRSQSLDTTLIRAMRGFQLSRKPTGAVVGQQPFGGARASGTNDKAGSKLNLVRWVSARTVKETFVPPRDYKYPFMNEE